MPSVVAPLSLPQVERQPLAGVTAALRAPESSAQQRAGVVAPVRTPITPDQASSLIHGALERLTGEPPSKETVAILTAQWAHETGRGASMFNYNFAGIKGSSPAGLSVVQRTREGCGSSERTITDSFRAYRTAEDGADDYVALLSRRFPGALEAAKQGDPAGTVRALKQAGYFTGDEVAYTRSVTSLAQEFAPGATNFVSPELPALPVEYSAALADARGAGASGGAPFVSGSAMSDHILRAALGILASTESAGRSESST